MFNKLTERVYYMDFVEQGDRPVLGLVLGDKDSLIIDGGNSKAHAMEFLEHISKLDIPKPKYLVLTHHHWDHVFGMKYMNLINISHIEAKKKIKWMQTFSWKDEAIRKRVEDGVEIEFCEEHIKIEHPNDNREIEIADIDITFTKEMEINLGGVTVKLEHVDTDHSKDSCIVTVIEERVTFMGDSMYLDMYNGPYSYTKEKLYPFLDKLKSYNSNYYIPAHHPKYNNKEFMEFVEKIKQTGDIAGDSKDLISSLQKFEVIKGEKLNQWDIEDLQGFIEGNKKK
ncbi:MAG: MBL fold metallo-hydrolase [Sarcina sp.]